LQESNLIKMTPNSRRWDDLFNEYLAGEAVTWLGKAQGWLEKDLHQKRKSWAYVFEGYLLAEQQYLENFILVYKAFNKIDDNEKVKSDIKQANSVLNQVCHRCEQFLKVITPFALNHGTVLHIGTSEGVYRRGMAVSDMTWDSLGGISTRLSVGIAERIWTIGKGKHVWTGYENDSNWKKTSITAEDIWVVKQDPEFSAGKGLVSDVYTIEDGKFCWRIWDNAIEADARKPEPARWEKFIQVPGAPEALGGKKYTAVGPWGVRRIDSGGFPGLRAFAIRVA
jgi:hypothetical protein